MLTRLTHAGIAFALTVALYQGYVLAVAPFVEPAGAIGPVVQAISPEDLARPPASLQQYKPLLQAYFPVDHWCLQTPPKIIDNGQTMVVFDGLTQSPGGELSIPRVVVVFFPGVRDRSAAPPRDAIIMEPAGGATMQMDQQVGKRFGSMGRMQFGQLLGKVIIRSDMNEPGPQDDLLIDAKDLYMNQDFIRTTEAVTMSLGRHQGRGRGMVLRFFKSKGAASSGSSTLFGRLDSLEISNEVAALIMPGSTTMFGTPTDKPAPPGQGETAKIATRMNDAPAEIKCTGPFQIDFNKRTATFSDDVHVWQRHPDGSFDELVASRALTLYFAETREWGGDPAPDAASSTLGSMQFEPATVEALGRPDAPVTLRAQSQGASATGDRLCIELLARQVTLEGEKEVSLQFRGAEIHAPMVRYELPPKDSNRRLGMMYAKGGLGWLRAAPDLKRPNDILEVRWTQSMQMVRRGGQPVLILDGRPRVAMPGFGVLLADQLEIVLRERPVAPQSSSTSSPPNGSLVPASIDAERIVASGSVVIESPELNGSVDQLDLRILQPPTVGAVMPAAPSVANAEAGSASPATPPSLFDRRQGRAGGRTYTITGRTLEIDAVTRDRQPQVSAIRVDGNVVFKESSASTVGEAPLRILAEHLNVTDADTAEAKIEIRGNESAGTAGSLAEISARGTILRAPLLAVNRGTSQAWINSPGEVQMLVTRDAMGKPLNQPQPLAITWRDAMELNRDRINFTGNVHVQHPDGWLRTQRLTLVLTAPVQFDGATSSKPPELAQLECWNGAVAEFEQHDPVGALTSRQHIEINSLVVNQITGAIRGEGPGLVDSVHLSKGDGSFLVMPEGVNEVNGQLQMPAAVQQDVAGPPQLRHLHIDFVRGVDGNIHTPQVRVFGDVRAIYGPVPLWDARLQMTPGGGPGPDVIWIECDSLQVTDSPLARIQTTTASGDRRAFGQVELTAETNVIIEGAHPQHGAFTLRGERAAYDQAKTMFVLEGNQRTRANITRQEMPGAPFQTQSARKFIYWQSTGKIKVEGFDKVELNQFDSP